MILTVSDAGSFFVGGRTVRTKGLRAGALRAVLPTMSIRKGPDGDKN
jgi:hypothetical protein